MIGNESDVECVSGIVDCGYVCGSDCSVARPGHHAHGVNGFENGSGGQCPPENWLENVKERFV